MNAGAIPYDLRRQVQGLPLTGYNSRVMRTLLLSVRDAPRARDFLGGLLDADLLDFGGTARTKADLPHRINIGFSYEGLRALRVAEDILSLLKKESPAFGEGAAPRAARHLGDSGQSAADRWAPAFQHQRSHVWISIHADDAARADAALRTLQAVAGAQEGLAGWDPGRVPLGQHLLDPADPAVRKVHFGFRDNLTKPSILSGRGAEAPQEAGELLLGYPNNRGTDLWAKQGTAPEITAFLRNGSFGILRQIQQHESRFDAWLERQVEALHLQDHAFVTKDYLKAKLCGRWPEGAVMAPHQKVQPAPPGKQQLAIVDFQQDPHGWGCPFGAHIRRANPRKDPLRPERHRVLFRRSVPYGPRYGDAPGDDVNRDLRGLVGVFFCARIEDQFEQLVSEWLEKNPMGPPNPGRAKDPIAGRHDEPEAEFHIPVLASEPIVLRGFVPFVRTRGTLYALFPSRRALETMVTGDYWRRP